MEWIKRIIAEVEPIHDDFYGPRYRCSLTLKDGTVVPCAVLQSKERLVALAKRRIKEEMNGGGRTGGSDPYDQIIETFLANGNRVNDYDVAAASASRFAIPLALLAQIHGETAMSWTGWVFRMRDGRSFAYGTSFSTEFFQLPDGYEFSDVQEVFSHSYVNADGSIASLERGRVPPVSYRSSTILRERLFFTCAVNGV